MRFKGGPGLFFTLALKEKKDRLKVNIAGRRVDLDSKDQLASVAQRVKGAIHWINHYPLDNCYQNLLIYPMDND